MNVTFNRDRRAFMAAVDGRSEFAFHTQLRAHELEEEVTHDQAVCMFQAAVGAPIGVDVLSRGTWVAGYAPPGDHRARRSVPKFPERGPDRLRHVIGIRPIRRVASLSIAEIRLCAACICFVPFRKKIIDPRIFLCDLIQKSRRSEQPRS